MTYRCMVRRAAAAAGFTVFACAGTLHADTRPIDIAHSTMTVFVYKSGLFSGFADNHIISAPIAAGSLSDGQSPGVELTVRAADLKVTDPGLSIERRADVQARMTGAEVLDVAKFPEITFASTTIAEAGRDRWTVTGRLTIHGQTRSVTFPVGRLNGMYRGEVAIKQRDFGIEPIKVAGGTVKVKDEVKIAFEIADSLGRAGPPR